MKYIDKFLNSITMYRLVLYGLTTMAGFAILFGFLGIISYSGWSLLMSVGILGLVTQYSNVFLSKVFKAPVNIESAGITSFILFFIMVPVSTLNDALILVAAALIAMASKYMFAIHKKHIFNPAAIAPVLIGLTGLGAAAWWVATITMVPFVLILGFLVVRKIRRFTLFFSFVVTSLVVMSVVFSSLGLSVAGIFTQVFISFPLLFFGTIMLTEPSTMPPTRKLQIVYGIFVGILFSLQFKIGPIFSTPELALVIGNIFSYTVSMKRKVVLTLKSKSQLSNLIHDFEFVPDHRIDFHPGQYLEWTLPHEKHDDRGNRRYFTIASSPTESEVHLGVRIQPDGSSFKNALLALQPGGKMMVGSLSGEFILPSDIKTKLVFIAGGIGVTPFRSMVKYMIDKKIKYDTVLFYAAASENDFVYTDIFDVAEKEIGMKTIRIVSDAAKVSGNWKGKTGFITRDLIEVEVPDYKDRIFYLSGPDPMVQSYKKLLLEAGVSWMHIKTDYFPGY